MLLDNEALLTLEGNPDFLEAAQQLSALLDGEVVPLHRDTFYLFPNDTAQQVWVFESLEPLRVPSPFEWCDFEGLASLEERELLELHLRETLAHRQSWQCVGWLREAQGWVTAQLPSATPLEIQNSWHGALNAVSSVDGRKVYFKALPNALTRKLRLVPLLSKFSHALPEVIAVNEARGWVMTWSAGDTHLIRDGDVQHWKTALRELASLQIATLPAHDRLEQAGCQRLTPRDALLEASAICEDSDSEFAASAQRQLEVMTEKLEFLEQLGLPLALAHGDFHPMNVIAPATIIDWSDALIAHPFTDLERFLRWIIGTRQPHPWTPFADTRALEPEFIAAYLEPWTVFAPLERLNRHFLRHAPVWTGDADCSAWQARGSAG